MLSIKNKGNNNKTIIFYILFTLSLQYSQTCLVRPLIFGISVKFCYVFIWKSILIMSTPVGDRYTPVGDRNPPVGDRYPSWRTGVVPPIYAALLDYAYLCRGPVHPCRGPQFPLSGTGTPPGGLVLLSQYKLPAALLALDPT